MFRFDPESKQWKERGVGEIKILKSKDQVKFRIIMRRDQVRLEEVCDVFFVFFFIMIALLVYLQLVKVELEMKKSS